MLRQLAAVHAPLRLNRPFRISRGVKSVADTIRVEICEGTTAGQGESVPYARYGETIDSVLAQIWQAQEQIEQGASRQQLLELMPPGAARNAVDCALWDLEARLSGQSVTASIGWPALKPVATAMTVSLDTPANMAAAAKAMSNCPLLKIKVNADDPLAAIRAVREVAPAPRIIVDPNESWSLAQLAEWQDDLVTLRVDLLEQPLPADEDGALENFDRRIKLAADESGHIADDLAVLARRYDFINIKLDKAGGLTMALTMLGRAEREGMGLMIGCMVSSSLSIAPAMVIAQRCSFVDLDGPTWLAEDLMGGVRECDGVMAPPQAGFWGEV